jgi:hypothetical protein
MPFRKYTGFDAKTLDIMTAAYDDACKILSINGDDPRSSALAIAIVTAANAGERNHARLVEAGVVACSRSEQT